MSAPIGVLGVLTVCSLVSPTLHSASPVNTGPLAECVRCVRFTRVRTRVREKISPCSTPVAHWNSSVISLREASKPLHTLHTLHRVFERIVFIGVFVCWVCVGLAVFVLAWVFGAGVGQ